MSPPACSLKTTSTPNRCPPTDKRPGRLNRRRLEQFVTSLTHNSRMARPRRMTASYNPGMDRRNLPLIDYARRQPPNYGRSITIFVHILGGAIVLSLLTLVI